VRPLRLDTSRADRGPSLSRGTIRTIRGDVPASEIGITSIHEHILSDARVWFEDASLVSTIEDVSPGEEVSLPMLGTLIRNPMVLRDNLLLDDEAMMIAELSFFAARGGDCIVDCTPFGLGGSPQKLRRVSEATGLHIVAGCGYYVEESHPRAVAEESADALAARLVRAVEGGVDDTDARAGIIGEIGTSTLSQNEEKVLVAAARAHMGTGAAVSVHTDRQRLDGDRILDLLIGEGMDPRKIILGHMDENLTSQDSVFNLARLDYHRRMLDRGVWVAYDTFGSEFYCDDGPPEPRDTERAMALSVLIHEGFADQLLVAQDIWLKTGLKQFGGSGYDHILRVVPQMLVRRGVSTQVIQQLLTTNPRRVLTLSDP
jgi:phosphotriesterase-related protein